MLKDDFIVVKGEYINIYNKSFLEIDGIKISLSVGENEDKIIPDSLIAKSNNDIDIVLNPSAKTRFIGSRENIEEKIKFLSKKEHKKVIRAPKNKIGKNNFMPFL